MYFPYQSPSSVTGMTALCNNKMVRCPLCRLYRPIWSHEWACGSQQVLADPVGCRVLPQPEHCPQGPEGGCDGIIPWTIKWLTWEFVAGRESTAGLEHEHQDSWLWILQLLPERKASCYVVWVSALCRPRGVRREEVYGARNRHLGELLWTSSCLYFCLYGWTFLTTDTRLRNLGPEWVHVRCGGQVRGLDLGQCQSHQPESSVGQWWLVSITFAGKSSVRPFRKGGQGSIDKGSA